VGKCAAIEKQTRQSFAWRGLRGTATRAPGDATGRARGERRPGNRARLPAETQSDVAVGQCVRAATMGGVLADADPTTEPGGSTSVTRRRQNVKPWVARRPAHRGCPVQLALGLTRLDSLGTSGRPRASEAEERICLSVRLQDDAKSVATGVPAPAAAAGRTRPQDGQRNLESASSSRVGRCHPTTPEAGLRHRGKGTVTSWSAMEQSVGREAGAGCAASATAGG
jgi:hypothetical protein